MHPRVRRRHLEHLTGFISMTNTGSSGFSLTVARPIEQVCEAAELTLQDVFSWRDLVEPCVPLRVGDCRDDNPALSGALTETSPVAEGESGARQVRRRFHWVADSDASYLLRIGLPTSPGPSDRRWPGA